MKEEIITVAAASSKNKKKKEQKKKMKNKKEIIEAIMQRNKSKIKCPKQLDEQGILSHLSDIRLKNYNPISAYSSRLAKQKRRRSTNS